MIPVTCRIHNELIINNQSLLQKNKYLTGLQLTGPHQETVELFNLFPVITECLRRPFHNGQQQSCGGLEQHHNTASSKQL